MSLSRGAVTRDDPILGTVRLCRGCGEEWPLDDEFWHMQGDQLSTAWPFRCRACCVDYYAVRRRLSLETRRSTWTQRDLPVEGRCNRVLRTGAYCGRMDGHSNRCRSQLAMLNDSVRQRPERAA